MIEYIKRKIRRFRQKRTFQEYGYVIKHFELADDGQVAFADWLHPFHPPMELDESKLNFFKRYIRRGDMAIDIGAYTGDTTVPMALAAGREGLTLGLEPNPYVFKILEKNAGLNADKTRILPLNFAATEADGTYTFHYYDASFVNGGYLSRIERQDHRHRYALEVRGKFLPEYLRRRHAGDLARLSFIKIDAEGYDKEIIKTLRQTLVERRPAVVAECLKRLVREEREDLFHALADCGYRLFYFADFHEDAERVAIDRPEDMMRWRHFNILAIPQERSFGHGF
jgi:FkbM family methyltransferase